MLNLPRPWRLPLLSLALAWAVLAGLYAETAGAMVAIWNRSETFAHAWVVPPISVWLVWRLRGDLVALVPRPALGWLWGLPLLGLLWLVGELAAAQSATQFAWVGMLVLAVPVLLGTEVARRIAFPLGFLFFAVPFGDFLTPWLIERTADFTVAAVRLSGVPVFREGTQFIIPTGSWSVVQACSGIRYLMASVMVGTLFAYLNYRSSRKRWAFVGVAIVTPLVANWLRAYMIVMLGHLSNNKLATGVDHIIYGWVFFGLIMLLMFMVGARWSDAEPAPRAAPPGADDRVESFGRVAMAAGLVLVLLAMPPALRAQAQRGAPKVEPVLAAPAVPGWVWRAQPLGSWRPSFHGPAAELHGRFEPEAGGAAMGLYIGYYRDQHYGRQLITSVNQLADGEGDKGWSETGQGMAQLDTPAGRLDWRTTDLRGQALSEVRGDGSGAPRLRVWQLYWVNGQPLASDWQAKLYGAWQSLLGYGDDAAVVLVYADKAQVGTDDARLRDFIARSWPAVDTALRGVRHADAMPAH